MPFLFQYITHTYYTHMYMIIRREKRQSMINIEMLKGNNNKKKRRIKNQFPVMKIVFEKLPPQQFVQSKSRWGLWGP